MLQPFMEKEAQNSKVDEAINERTSIRKTTWRWFTEREKKKDPKGFGAACEQSQQCFLPAAAAAVCFSQGSFFRDSSKK